MKGFQLRNQGGNRGDRCQLNALWGRRTRWCEGAFEAQLLSFFQTRVRLAYSANRSGKADLAKEHAVVRDYDTKMR